MGRHLRTLSSGVLLLGLLSSLAVGLGAAPASAAPSNFITRQGTRLILNGQPYRFSGFNVFNANSNNNCGPYAATGPTLDNDLAAVGEQHTVLRTWFFQSLATAPDGVTRDWRAFDHTIAVARARHLHLIAALDNQWGECENYSVYGAGYKTESWYAGGYRTARLPRTPKPYRDWVAEVVAHYRNEPTIGIWSLVNEPEDAQQYRPRTCSSTATATMQRFVADVAPWLKAHDPNHLVSLGTIGSGQCGDGGRAYGRQNAVSAVDVCELHDYSYQPLPGDQYNGFTNRINACTALNKPLVVAEAGINPARAGGSYTDRATLFAAKRDAQFGAGVAGMVTWNWRAAADGGSSLSDFWIGPQDPALPVLHLAAAAGNGLLVSTSPNRREPMPLSELTLRTASYVFTQPPAGTVSVAYYLDNAAAPFAIARQAPWDVAGQRADGSALPLSTTGLATGAHALTAVATGTSGVTTRLPGGFYLP